MLNVGQQQEGTLSLSHQNGTLNHVNSVLRRAILDVADAIKAGNAYVNVHTVAFPSGEVRGQIMPTS